MTKFLKHQYFIQFEFIKNVWLSMDGIYRISITVLTFNLCYLFQVIWIIVSDLKKDKIYFVKMFRY